MLHLVKLAFLGLSKYNIITEFSDSKSAQSYFFDYLLHQELYGFSLHYITVWLLAPIPVKPLI